ncbi:pentatricopeptide repeat (PPR) superfamily protein [Actinidia rufa]|uniref:Pentatricopeptide repeat (PPR) superfamily protein n=1 Tax=Actinidia rufa TaxID=165716 RepID=A0A7J0FN26_9ERIC|nr:pentatricopeptide repeat (PPR) superfamily protein [Actinidia rufa]GFZ00002.1 pentatricopeptide repeat (PPR) superfamily protein [Actinidia rufa]
MLAFDQPKPTLNHHVLAILERCNHINHLKQLQAFLIALGHGHTQFFAFKLVRFCTLALVNLPYARSIFDHLASPNVFLYTAMVTAYSSRSDHKSALLLYRDMVRRKSPRPNHFIFPHVLKSCPEVLGSRGTELVHTQIVKSGFAQYPVVQTALLDSYSRFCSDLGTARKVFDEMSERNVVSWTAMVSGYARLGKMGSAVLMFEEMPERDVPAWNAVIAGCTQNGLFSESISLFRRMVTMEEDNRPNQVTVVCSLSACGHTGMLQLVKKLVEIDPKNGGYGAMLANVYVESGKWDEVRKVRKTLKEQNAYKTPGCSWIEVDNRVHQFYSVDTTHPRTEEIYTILECLGFS